MSNLYSVNSFAEKHSQAFKIGGLRSLIFNEHQNGLAKSGAIVRRSLIFNEHQNGLAKSGAIVRVGRKVLIDSDKFFSWIALQNQGGK